MSLRLVHETARIFTPDGRRKLVRYLLDRPEAELACAQRVSVDVRERKMEAERGELWPAPRKWATTFGPERA